MRDALMLTAGKPNSAEEKIPGQGTARWRSPSARQEVHTLDTIMHVTTPENISFNYQIAGPFRRVFAYALDILMSVGAYMVVVVLIYILVTFAFIPLAAMIGGATIVEAIMGVLGGLIAVGYFIVYWFYGAYMETYYNGQTLGKRFTRMRAISTDGSAIDGVQATLRNFFRLLDIMPLVPFTALFELDMAVPGGLPTCLFGLVIMTLSPKFQRVGDLVANTVVVSEEKKRLPDLAIFSDDRVPQLAELIPTSFVVPASMARAIADYVNQRKYLPFQRGSEIAAYVSAPLIEKFGLQSDTDYDLFLCALYYKTFVSSQTDAGSTAAVLPNGIIAQSPVGGVAAPQVATEVQLDVSENELRIEKSDFRVDPE